MRCRPPTRWACRLRWRLSNASTGRANALLTPDQATEIERLIGLGASTTGTATDFIVLEDTEGNRFSVIDASRR